MQAADVLFELHRMGITLSPLPGGKIEARPKRALTDDARRLIRSNKVALLAELVEEARIRSWLRSIGEDDPGNVREILERARNDPEAPRYFLERAAMVARPAFYESMLGNEAKSVVTLEPEQIAEAARIGLLPREIAESDAVIVAYRNGGVQGLMMIPAERYDGLKLLALFADG